MTSYRRILVPILNNGQSDRLLRGLQDLLAGQHAQVQVLVVRVLDAIVDFEPDGPAANLPGEIVARRAIDAERMLALQLARHKLGWVEARVIWQDPFARLTELVAAWQPDLVIAGRGPLPIDIPSRVDVLHTGGGGFLRRLADTFAAHVPRHA